MKLEKKIGIVPLSIFKDESLDILKTIFDNLKSRYSLTTKEILDLIYQKPKYILIPIAVLKTRLAPLESIVKYLKEEVNLSFNEIALFLNRDATTIWTSYRNAKRKRAERFVIKKAEFFIPILILKNRKLSILESIAKYLIEVHHLRYHEIAYMLNRDDRTIWTVYNRVRKKRG